MLNNDDNKEGTNQYYVLYNQLFMHFKYYYDV